jgi:hypothetical protein
MRPLATLPLPTSFVNKRTWAPHPSKLELDGRGGVPMGGGILSPKDIRMLTPMEIDTFADEGMPDASCLHLFRSLTSWRPTAVPKAHAGSAQEYAQAASESIDSKTNPCQGIGVYLYQEGADAHEEDEKGKSSGTRRETKTARIPKAALGASIRTHGYGFRADRPVCTEMGAVDESRTRAFSFGVQTHPVACSGLRSWYRDHASARGKVCILAVRRCYHAEQGAEQDG